MEMDDHDVTWPLGRSVVRGEIDNTVRKKIAGRIWLKGREEPLELDVRGDCMRDIAGCRIAFTNEKPLDGDDVDLACLQTGIAGEMTASRKIRFLDESLAKGGLSRTGNCLYLEWFSDVNGRVVLEGPDFRVDVVESAWYMTPKEEETQVKSIAGNLARWEREIRDYEAEETHPRRLNEFEWEKSLRESDALTDRFSKVLEKYLDDPNCDKLIAREMGWTWLLDSDKKDADGKPIACEIENEMMDDFDDDDFELDPNPLTEGIDWIRGSNGRVTHPLTNRSFSIAMDLWSYCKKTGYLSEDADQDVRDMIFQVQTLTAKLAGALDGLAYDVDTDGGFVVACLKRSLPYINRALASADSVLRKAILEEERVTFFRKRMLEVREEIIRLMSRYRKQAD
jgi:hypothetical protein